MIDTDRKCIIVFSGFNQRAVIAFLRTLELNNINYAIIAKSRNDDIFATEYKNKVVAIRESETIVENDILISIEKVKEYCKAKEYLIAPTTEALNRFLIDKRRVFEELGCIIPLVKKNLYELISDKLSFSQLCEKNEIIVPKNYEFSLDMKLPIVAKPKKYFSISNKEILSPIILKDLEELQEFYKKYEINDFYYQEFIKGISYYLLYYFHRNGDVYKFSQQNLVQQPQGKSMIAAITTDFHNSQESNKYEKLFRSIGFNGLVMVEVIEKDNLHYMIEANPRFWGPSQLFVDAEANLFEVFLHDYGFIEWAPDFNYSNYSAKYFWFGGIFLSLKNKLNLNFYNTSKNEFLNLLPDWLESDVYKRDDTLEIFKKELLNE
ncbi:ATP-grasp domain-containing protein [Clostridium sp. AL.422]|uniref:ATP-grasp domain-containing protein n=1 Tax=Clostridium TaxID=1485 RepID=UPI00293DDCDA|nr:MULTISPECIES: ATP-grasp domain-containing protein [unclassified Clostridium]MDV4149714.1 ATP-grasp domain-containing protein [Clostridium sp. AL.422]